MIRFTKDGKVDARWTKRGGTDIPVSNSYSDLADALDVAVAALRDIEKNYYNTMAGRWKATTALRQIGADQ